MGYKRIRWLLLMLMATLTGYAQTTIDLIDNDDGTWSASAMPDYNVAVEVEYETDYSLTIDLTDNGNGTWSVSAMPDYNVAVEVEYETDYSLIIGLTDNGDGTWSANQMPDYSVAVVAEYEDVDLIANAPVAKSGLVYNGKSQQLVTAGTAQGGVMKYSLDGTNFSETIPTAVEVGLYTVYYMVMSTTLNCGDSPVQTLTVRISANQSALSGAIEEAETLYASIKDLLPDAAATLLGAINAAIAVQENVNASQADVNAATQTMQDAIQTAYGEQALVIDLTDNGDGTWSVASMLDKNFRMVAEYEDDLSLIVDLADNGDGTWSAVAMPDYKVKMVVEYEDDLSLIVDLKKNADGTWSADKMPGYNVKMVVEISDWLAGDANGDGVVNIADVVAIVNKIYGNPPADFDETAADVNGDGVVNTADVVKVVEIISGN